MVVSGQHIRVFFSFLKRVYGSPRTQSEAAAAKGFEGTHQWLGGIPALPPLLGKNEYREAGDSLKFVYQKEARNQVWCCSL